MRAGRRRAAALLLVLLLAGCATPSPTYSDYQAKVATTAKAVAGMINTAKLGAQTWQRGQTMKPYADTVVSNAEQDAGSVINTLDSRQPPATGRCGDQAEEPARPDPAERLERPDRPAHRPAT